MAATPPMPPGTTANSNQLNGDVTPAASNESHDTNKPQTVAEALNQHFIQRRKLSKCSLSRWCSNEQLLQETEDQQVLPAKTKLNCQCTNISIMHLFHEMKQEFPTIPDAIVTQCVNENCHQRENCIQMLRKELALHPIPVQSYPAKVLQQQQQRQATKPPTPLKPTRVAPTQPPQPTTTTTTPTTPTTPPSSNGQQPRARPTTLNLQRQLNTQLQQKIHQRQQQQQPQQRRDLTPTSLNKPLRRAPPLPPQQQPPPLAPKPSSFSNDSSCLTSPMSSSESEISLNALSSPTAPAPAAATAAASSPSAAATPATTQQASPIRHRSVITLQPEPPYARDFLTPPSPTSVNPTTTAGRKSFTSLNLTLRQPTTTGVAQSAIDITAGPAPSGQGSGITYSSSSFDAVRGTHKNFQLTVTDEGSVFSAGCIGPRQQQQATQVYPSSLDADGSTATATAAVAMPEVFPYPTQAANHIVASNYNNNNNNDHGSSSTDSSPSVALYNGIVLDDADREAHAATIGRQKHRRDKLANALRDNKKRLLVLEQEINILTEPVPVGESERLDRDIKKLTEDCQRLINVLNDPQMNATGPGPNSMHRQQSAPAGSIPQHQHQQQPQPFPRQRPSVNRSQNPPNSLRFNSVPAPTAALQPNMDFVQQHSSAPTSACLTPQQPQLPQHPQLPMEPPPTYAQYYQFQQFLQHQRQQQIQQLQQQHLQQQQQQHQLQQQQQLQSPQQQQQASNYDEEFSESDVDDDEEPLDMWACNLCTFRNHPQLNMCEACENVRIQPGMIRIVPSNGGGAPPPPSQGDQPQSQQQPQPPQQPYALHT